MSASDDVSISFLDVLACAMGGSALLFLILSTLPHVGASAPKAAETITDSTVEATPVPDGDPSLAGPKLFRIEHPSGCILSVEQPDFAQLDFGLGNELTANDRPEHWLRLGPFENKEVRSATLGFSECPSGGQFIIRPVLDSAQVETAVRDVPATKGKLEYSAGTWRVRGT